MRKKRPSTTYYSTEVSLTYDGLTLEDMTKIMAIFEKDWLSQQNGIHVDISADIEYETNELTGTYTLRFSRCRHGFYGKNGVVTWSGDNFNVLDGLKEDIAEKLIFD
jgi:hypothetical protein